MVEMINDFEKANPDIGVREPFKDGTTMVSEIHAAHSLHPPGDESLALAVAEQADKHDAVLLANHGPVVAGADLSDAVYTTEELEETAKLFLMLQGQQSRPLSCDETTELETRFPRRV